MNEQHADVSNLTELTRITRVCLYASLALPLLSIWTDVSDLLGYWGEGPTAGFVASVILLAIARIGLMLITAIFVLMWIQQANRSARHLGAVDMKYTPGVGGGLVLRANRVVLETLSGHEGDLAGQRESRRLAR